MPDAFQKCPNCGATIGRAADGRAVVCEYCGAKSENELDPSALAASLNREFASVDQLFDHLATWLKADFPRHTTVEQEGGFFSSGRTIGFTVQIADTTYGMKREGRDVIATRKKVVRGIALKNEKLAIDAWVDALAFGLAQLANESAAAKAALQRFGRKG